MPWKERAVLLTLPGVGVSSHLFFRGVGSAISPPAPPGVASQRLEPPAGVWSQRPGVAPASSPLAGVASQRLTAGVASTASHSDFARFLQSGLQHENRGSPIQVATSSATAVVDMSLSWPERPMERRAHQLHSEGSTYAAESPPDWSHLFRRFSPAATAGAAGATVPAVEAFVGRSLSASPSSSSCLFFSAMFLCKQAQGVSDHPKSSYLHEHRQSPSRYPWRAHLRVLSLSLANCCSLRMSPYVRTSLAGVLSPIAKASFLAGDISLFKRRFR